MNPALTPVGLGEEKRPRPTQVTVEAENEAWGCTPRDAKDCQQPLEVRRGRKESCFRGSAALLTT